MTARGSIDFAAINAAALTTLATLVARWLPDGHRQAGEWVARNPRRQDRRPGSFSINLRTGVWRDFASDEGGSDPVSLLAHVLDLSQGAAARELAAELGMEGERQPGPLPRPEQRVRDAAAARQAEAEADLAKRIERARAIWTAARPDPHRELVASYLRSRAITLPLPPTIRSGDVWHPYARRAMPAMVAAVQQADGTAQGVHLTFLDPATSGKAKVDKARLMIGHARCGVVRLARAGPRMALAEGVETGASIQQACPELAVWCALSAGNMAKIELPPVVEVVTIFADGDANGVGERAARRAAEAYAAAGIDARVSVAPLGKDFNDLLRGCPAAELVA